MNMLSIFWFPNKIPLFFLWKGPNKIPWHLRVMGMEFG